MKEIYEKLEKKYGTEKMILYVALANMILKTLVLAVMFFILYLCLRCWI